MENAPYDDRPTSSNSRFEVIIQQTQIYGAVNCLVQTIRPRLAQLSRRNYTASYNENSVAWMLGGGNQSLTADGTNKWGGGNQSLTADGTNKWSGGNQSLTADGTNKSGGEYQSLTADGTSKWQNFAHSRLGGLFISHYLSSKEGEKKLL